MAFCRMPGLAAVSRFQGRGARSYGWIAARYAWAMMTFLFMTLSGVVVRVEAQESNATAVPVEIIRFERGASSKEISGAAIRGERSLYSLDAGSGQRLSVGISAAEDNAVFQIYGPGAQAERRDYGVEILGGKTLPGAGEGDDAKKWSGILPDTGTYLVVVGPTRGNATYTLTVSIR
jgi:hypothetical protein